MAIQKKSLISNRATVKKAVIAKSTLEPQTELTKAKAFNHSAPNTLRSSPIKSHSALPRTTVAARMTAFNRTSITN